jgi:hypothetical protein
MWVHCCMLNIICQLFDSCCDDIAPVPLYTTCVMLQPCLIGSSVQTHQKINHSSFHGALQHTVVQNNAVCHPPGCCGRRRRRMATSADTVMAPASVNQVAA